MQRWNKDFCNADILRFIGRNKSLIKNLKLKLEMKQNS